MFGRRRKILSIQNEGERYRALRDYADRLGVNTSTDNGVTNSREDALLDRVLRAEKSKALCWICIATSLTALGSLISGFALWAIARNINWLTNINPDYFRFGR